MAVPIEPCPQKLGAQTQIQSQIPGGFPIVLGKHRKVVLFVLVIINAATAEAPGWRAFQKVLKIAQAAVLAGEKQLPVENLREQFE